MKDPMIYDRIGKGYALGRRTDPRWMRAIVTAIGQAQAVVNVGAGAGSYEPAGQTLLAIEPSQRMLRQRDSAAASAVQGVAEHAYWRRPHAYLDQRVRQACSAFAQTDNTAVARGIRLLRQDLETGQWDKRHSDLLRCDEIDAGFRLIIANR